MKNEMSDAEFAIQLMKLFLGFVFGLGIVVLLWHINHHLASLDAQILPK